MKFSINKLLVVFVLSLIPFVDNAQSSCVGTAGQVRWSYWAGFSTLPDSTDLYVLENFPSHPDGTQTLGSLKAPNNFNENFAGMIRGYISVPTTETYRFNLTADDKAIFYLSTDDTPIRKRKRAEVTSYTGITEYNKQASQTSQSIELVGGRNYYFEMLNFEGCCSDHMTLYWRKPSNPDTTWLVVDYNYIKEYTCGQNCPVRGTACNDGNANTTNDQEDGFCNCIGTYPTANACIGDKGVVEAYYYDGITGNYVEPDLVNSPKFPLLPDRKEKLNGAYGPLVPSSKDNYGTLLQGFLTVPITGTYEFNITGDNQTYFFLSKNDSIQYKQTHQAIVISGVEDTEHGASTFQSTGPLYLEKGKYYYYEFRHKDNTWRDYFNLFWKTPFHEVRSWKRVSKFYLFDYKCEISCIPAGTLCNDNNPFTKNDKYDNNCNCVGTPCSGPDCDDITAQYQFYESCAPTKNLVPDPLNSWVSCTSLAPNPNTARSSQQHWIKYDLGDIYRLQGTRVWNYNVESQTDRGVRNLTVDYSLDGNTWTSLGTSYEWPQAPGSADYSGFIGPNFNNVKARYVLISAVSTWGASCAGFSKITFDAALCNPKGTSCDDNDPLTLYDKFDNNCNCKGVNIACASDTLKLDKMTLADGAFKAKKVVQAESLVPTTKNISFTAGNSIVLMPGFEVNNSAIFSAKIEDCLQAAFAANEKANQAKEAETDSTASEFSTKEGENPKLKKIIFRLNKPSQVKLSLKDSKQNVVVMMIDEYYQNLGTQIKYLPTNKLAKGEYWVELVANDITLKEKLLIE